MTAKCLATTKCQRARRLTCSAEGGFIVDEQVYVEGSVMAHGPFWMIWKAPSVQDLTREHFALLELIRPAPELLVLGCGLTHQIPPVETMRWLRSIGVGVEVLPTVRPYSLYTCKPCMHNWG